MEKYGKLSPNYHQISTISGLFLLTGSKSKSPVRSKGKDEEEKAGRSKKSKKTEGDDDDDYKSDSSNFDPELEKEIKGICKSLASDGKGKKKKKGKESQEGSEAEDKKGKKGKEKKKTEKKGLIIYLYCSETDEVGIW